MDDQNTIDLDGQQDTDAPDPEMRPDLVGELVGNLLDGTSVLVTGPPASGKSRILRLVAEEFNQSGVPSVLLRGIRAFSGRSMVALVAAGVGREKSRTTPGEPSLAQLSRAFRAIMERPQSILFIDDAGDLDQGTVGSIAVARAAKKFPVLATSRTGINTTLALTDIAAIAQPGIEVALDGLAFGEIDLLVNTRLSGIVAPGTVSQIAMLSGGLPGLVEVIVDSARSTGRLALVDGVWRAVGELWNDRLGFVLQSFFAGLDRPEVDALTNVALGVPDVESVSGTGVVRRLAQLGLVRISHDPPLPEIRVFPPALAELLRRASGAAVTKAPDYLRYYRDLSRQLATLSGNDAASFANRVLTHWREQIAIRWDQWESDRRTALAVPVLAAMLAGPAEPEELDAVIAQTELDTSDPVALTDFVVLEATHRAIWRSDVEGALTELRHHQKAFPEFEMLARAYESHLILTCDRVPDLALLEPEADGQTEGQQALRSARAEVLLARGDVLDADALLAEYHAHAIESDEVNPDTSKGYSGTGATSGHAVARIAAATRVYEELALVLGDDVEGGVAQALDSFQQAMDTLDPVAIFGHAYVAALGMTMLGRFSELDGVVDIAFRLADTNVLNNHFKTGLFMLASIVAGWDGRHGWAHSLSAQAKALGAGSGPFPGMFASLSALHDASTSTDQLWDMVDDMVEKGYVANAVFLAVAAAEDQPKTTRAGAIIALGEKSQSRVLRALASYITVTTAGDLNGFESVVDELRQSCGRLDATRARITWALALREAGDNSGWLEQAEAAWYEGANLGRRWDGLFARLVNAVDLAGREPEVAGYAAQGRSSAEIATMTGLATRTVEAYLSIAYRKIGVRTRQDLSRAVSTWLAL